MLKYRLKNKRMAWMYRLLAPIRKRRSAILSLLLSISFLYNVVFLVMPSSTYYVNTGNSRTNRDEFCKTILNLVGVTNILDYIKKENELNPDGSFFKELKQCFENKENITIISSNNLYTTLQTKPSVQTNHTNANFIQNDVIKRVTLTNKTISNSGGKNGEIESFLALPIINPHEYSYTFNQPLACNDIRIKYIIAIPSAPGNFDNREKVRQHQAGSFVKDPNNRAKMLFFLGSPMPKPYSHNHHRIQNLIKSEQLKFGDIIQSNFIDSYRNLTKKASLILRWSVTYCAKSKFIIRMDDDLRINLPLITKTIERYIKNTTINKHFILGKVVKDWGPVRDKMSKYYTTKEEYPYDKLPPFILGGTYGYSVATAELLFQAYQRMKPFWLDDVFITAMCASKVGVSIYNSSAFEFKHWKW